MSSIENEIAAARRVLHEAMELQSAGNLAAAAPRYRMVIEQGYRVTEVRPILAGILAQLDAVEEAMEQWNALLAVEPDHAVAHHEMALILNRLGQTDEAIVSMEHACRTDPENPVAANNLAVMLSNAGRKREALREFQRALDLQPENVHVRHQLRRLGAEQVPFWHVPMMNDVRRNDAFEAAIKAAIATVGSDAQVLDIGTGSGLLSMMAARAGAESVVACEIVPIIADMAQKIVADNGYADQITIFAQPSTELQVGVELPAKADILVSEILSSDLLTEAVLDTFEDAHARLLKPDAIIIPRAASAIGCLVESDVLAGYSFVDQVSGFNVSRFGAFAAQKLPIHGTMTDWRRLSKDVELVRVDLTQRRHESDLHILSIPVLEDGMATGIVQWMHVDLAEGVTFDNHPDGYSDGGWLQVLHSFPQPIQVRAGQVLDLAVGHDRATLVVQPLEVVAGSAAIRAA
ncbi:protein arginine N-methyltransferase [Sphingobium sufflavum]|uniref:50S ribosomal protein L11 methyltransferase n=1 Tax=Sphingobium sufflavum TaxID=1129547 RepID=UPI001F473396|nr:50S ribosomal protein L11 methyltransferase [Sphingobium sufflavum]MCE7797992.1 protein arginine N-methyltransferase [Sphingobium sufflavum]